MPYFEDSGRSIYFETAGSPERPAVLLIAPGGMKSAIGFWSSTPWNPIETLSAKFHVIAMDQRNAGQSTAPVTGADGWQTYAEDQLDLMDHLNITKFHVAGMCIGGPYSLGLIQKAPERVLSATLFQTIGRDNNQAEFYAMFDDWAAPLMGSSSAEESDWSRFRENMYGGDLVFFNVDVDFVRNVSTPLLVLEGNDVYHPQSSSILLKDNAPNVTYIEQWKTGEARDAAMLACESFLEMHS